MQVEVRGNTWPIRELLEALGFPRQQSDGCKLRPRLKEEDGCVKALIDGIKDTYYVTIVGEKVPASVVQALKWPVLEGQ